MVDQIGGWSSVKVGDGYAEGFRVKTNVEFMYRIIRHSLGVT